MIPIYLIVPRNYEYDDEYYNPAGYEEPSQGFLSRDKAEKARWKLEIESFRAITCCGEFTQEGLGGLTSHPEEQFVKELVSLGFDSEIDFARLDFGSTGPFASEPPADLMDKLVHLFDNLRFYEIVKIELAASYHDLASTARKEK